MAPLDDKTLGRAFVLLVCYIGLFHSTNATLKCYECEGMTPSDSCATNASKAKQVNCGGLNLSKCSITRVSDSKTNTMEKITRECHINVLNLAKTGCQEKGGKKSCTVFCDTDLCNDVEESKVDECVATDCKGAAPSTTPLVTSSMKCYECKGMTPGDSCATTPSTAPQVNCGSLKISQCSITRVSDSNTHVMQSIERRCHANNLVLGKSGCEERNGKKICTMFCDTHLCNDVEESKMDACAANNWKGAVTSTSPMRYLFNVVINVFDTRGK
ncbi:uncharacterized protein LOC135461326 isoform X2 [Liolophura sinensis]|uniref:uncharacterized protein LOC135461326 isoform X2 n=1 Tax=Liolophura sinensis TaxID=3198878 RepID=UPI00315837AC